MRTRIATWLTNRIALTAIAILNAVEQREARHLARERRRNSHSHRGGYPSPPQPVADLPQPMPPHQTPYSPGPNYGGIYITPEPHTFTWNHTPPAEDGYVTAAGGWCRPTVDDDTEIIRFRNSWDRDEYTPDREHAAAPGPLTQAGGSKTDPGEAPSPTGCAHQPLDFRNHAGDVEYTLCTRCGVML